MATSLEQANIDGTAGQDSSAAGPARDARDGQKLDVAVIICGYSDARFNLLKAAVESVRRQDQPVRQILVVVDHNDMLLDRAQRALSDVTVLRNEGAPGASGSRNTGVKAASSSIVAFLDDDAYAAPGWIAALVSGYQDPTVLGTGGSIAPAWTGGAPRWFPEEFFWTIGCTFRGLPLERAPIRNLIAANMSVRRDVYLQLGGFREGFGNVKVQGKARIGRLEPHNGDEEAEFCIRGLQRWPGAKWLYEPDAPVEHHVPPQRGKVRYFLSQCYDEGLGAATIVRDLGAADGLSEERAYTTKTLPSGVCRGVADMLVRRDPYGLARAGAIIAGFTVTAASYCLGRAVTLCTRRDT